MKQSLLLVLFIMCGLIGNAQKIHFTDTSNKWSWIFFTDDPYASAERSWYGSDTLIAGKPYRQLYASMHGSGSALAIREDTVQEKLFFRFIKPASDTGERLFFDYGLKAGDTLKIANGNSKFNYIVQKRDSLQLGGTYYRHWVLQGSWTPFEFLEAVGANWYPLQLVYPLTGLAGAQLRCFTNGRLNPLCKPAMPLPFANYIPHFPSEPYGAKFFDNDTSCALRVLPQPGGITGVSAAGQTNVFPNPGGNGMVFHSPSQAGDAFLQIRDFSGRIMLEQKVRAGGSIPIGQYLATPGVYSYILQDAASGSRSTGRFVYQ